MTRTHASTWHHSALTCLLVLSVTHGVRADDAEVGLEAGQLPGWLGADRAAARDSDRPWYGWQTLTTDGVAVGAMVSIGLVRDWGVAGALGLVGTSSYLLGAPIIHAAHGRWGAAFGSLGLRTVPILLSVGIASCGLAHPFGEVSGACAGLIPLAVLTTLAPIVLDPALLAYDDPPDPRGAVVMIAPWATPNSGGLSLARQF